MPTLSRPQRKFKHLLQPRVSYSHIQLVSYCNICRKFYFYLFIFKWLQYYSSHSSCSGKTLPEMRLSGCHIQTQSRCSEANDSSLNDLGKELFHFAAHPIPTTGWYFSTWSSVLFLTYFFLQNNSHRLEKATEQAILVCISLYSAFL